MVRASRIGSVVSEGAASAGSTRGSLGAGKGGDSFTAGEAVEVSGRDSGVGMGALCEMGGTRILPSSTGSGSCAERDGIRDATSPLLSGSDASTCLRGLSKEGRVYFNSIS